MAESIFIIIDNHAFRCELISEFFSHWMDKKEVSIVKFGCVSELLSEKGFVEGIGSNAAVTLSIGGASLSDGGVLKEILEIKKILGDCPLIVMADDTSDIQVRLASEIGVNGLISTAMPTSQVVATCEFVLGGGSYLPNGRSQWHLRRSDHGEAAISAIAQVRSNHPSEQDGDGERLRPSDCELIPGPLRIGEASKDLPCASSKGTVLPIDKLDNLTERQSEVIKALMLGMSNKEIARELDLSDATVKVHIRNLMKKLDASNRTKLAMIGAKLIDSSA